MILHFVFRFAGKSIKKHPEPHTAQGESKDPWFHLNLDEGPHSLPVTGLNRRGISSPRLRDATPINAFHTPQEYHVFPGSSRKNAGKEQERDNSAIERDRGIADFAPRAQQAASPINENGPAIFVEAMEKGRPHGRPSVWFNQPTLFSFRVRALFL